MSDINRLSLNDEYISNVLKNKVNNDEKIVIQILTKMFNKDKTPMTINNELKFEMFFASYVNTAVNPLKFEKMFDNPPSENSNVLDELYESKQIEYLVDYIVDKKIELIGSVSRFENFLGILFALFSKDAKSLLSNKISTLLTTNERNRVAKFIFDKDYNDEYNNLMSKSIVKNYSNNLNHYLRYNIVRSIHKKDNELIYSSKEWLEIMNSCLDNQISDDKVFTKEILDIFRNCIADIVKSKIVYDKEAIEKVKRLILESPQEYFKNFVILEMKSAIPDWNSIKEDSLWKEFFSTPEVFKEFIHRSEYNDFEKITTVRNFWALYENNKYKPIEFEDRGNVQKKIDSELIKEREQLDKILEISDEISEISDEMQPFMEDLYELTRNESPKKYFDEEDFRSVCLFYDFDDRKLLNCLIELDKHLKELNRVDKNGDEVYYLNIELLSDLKYYEVRTLKLMDVKQLDKIILAVREVIEEKRIRTIIFDKLSVSAELENECYNRLSPELNRFDDSSFEIDIKNIIVDTRTYSFSFKEGIFNVIGSLDSDEDSRSISIKVKEIEGRGGYELYNTDLKINYINVYKDLIWTDDDIN